MTLEYRPTAGLTINGKEANWGDDRQTIRKKLGIKFSEDDHVIDIASFTGGDASENLDMKRDLYGNEETLFRFNLNYDAAQKLESIEIHECETVQIGKSTLQFGRDINEIQKALLKFDSTGGDLESGEILFPQIKVVVASSEVMGGEGNGLSYFYAASSIDHLIE
jgi:hypothetical protein